MRWARGFFGLITIILSVGQALPQVCFVECKASRADFLRDHSYDGQMELCLKERDRNLRRKKGKRSFGRRWAWGNSSRA